MKNLVFMYLLFHLLGIACAQMDDGLLILERKETHHTKSHHHFEVLLARDSHDLHPLGLDYEFLPAYFHHALGFAVAGDYVANIGNEKGVVAATVNYHFMHHLRLMAGPGLNLYKEYTDYLTRLGGAYDFAFDHLSISPTLNVDILSEKVDVMMGLALGYTF